MTDCRSAIQGEAKNLIMYYDEKVPFNINNTNYPYI